MTIVIRVPLSPTEDQSAVMSNTMSDYTRACNYVSRYIFDNGFPLNSKVVNEAVYKIIRQRFNLGSQMAQSVIRDVIARYKTVKTQLSKRRVACGLTKTGKLRYTRKTLEYLEKPIKFSRPQACFKRDRDYRLLADTPKTRGLISMRMTSGESIRVRIAPSKRVDYPSLLRSYKSIFAMRLECDRGKWYALIAVEEVIEDQIEPYLAVGIDRGLINLAATYDENRVTSFFKGNEVARVRNHYQHLRARLQAKGTKGAKRRLKRLSGRENRWMTDVNHCLSKTLVSDYGPGVVLVLEDLTGVSNGRGGKGKLSGQLSSWAFYQLGEFVKYKAKRAGITVIEVSPDYTSQRCPMCMTVRKENRDQKRHIYKCSSCGYQTNDDRVAAMNLCELGVEYITGDPKPRITK